jgi:hypothetical protein
LYSRKSCGAGCPAGGELGPREPAALVAAKLKDGRRDGEALLELIEQPLFLPPRAIRGTKPDQQMIGSELPDSVLEGQQGSSAPTSPWAVTPISFRCPGRCSTSRGSV